MDYGFDIGDDLDEDGFQTATRVVPMFVRSAPLHTLHSCTCRASFCLLSLAHVLCLVGSPATARSPMVALVGV
jgi:hypothetical protein